MSFEWDDVRVIANPDQKEIEVSFVRGDNKEEKEVCVRWGEQFPPYDKDTGKHFIKPFYETVMKSDPLPQWPEKIEFEVTVTRLGDDIDDPLELPIRFVEKEWPQSLAPDDAVVFFPARAREGRVTVTTNGDASDQPIPQEGFVLAFDVIADEPPQKCDELRWQSYWSSGSGSPENPESCGDNIAGVDPWVIFWAVSNCILVREFDRDDSPLLDGLKALSPNKVLTECLGPSCDAAREFQESLPDGSIIGFLSGTQGTVYSSADMPLFSFSANDEISASYEIPGAAEYDCPQAVYCAAIPGSSGTTSFNLGLAGIDDDDLRSGLKSVGATAALYVLDLEADGFPPSTGFRSLVFQYNGRSFGYVAGASGQESTNEQFQNSGTVQFNLDVDYDAGVILLSDSSGVIASKNLDSDIGATGSVVIKMTGSVSKAQATAGSYTPFVMNWSVQVDLAGVRLTKSGKWNMTDGWSAIHVGHTQNVRITSDDSGDALQFPILGVGNADYAGAVQSFLRNLSFYSKFTPGYCEILP